MKTLLLILLLAPALLAAGPKYQQKDSLLQAEIDNIYRDIALLLKGDVHIHATTTNDNALAGDYGYSVSSVTANAVNFPASAVIGDLLSITLAGGDWTCMNSIYISTNTAAFSDVFAGMSQVSGNSASGLVAGDNYSEVAGHLDAQAFSLPPVISRLSNTGGTTVYLKYSGTYTIGTPTARGKLFCWKPR